MILPPVGFVAAGFGVPYVLPAGTLSFVDALPLTDTLMFVSLKSGVTIGAGFTKICKVAVAQAIGNPPHTVYVMSTGPLKPGAAIKLYVPFGFIVNVPVLAGIVLLPVTVNGDPPLFLSLLNTLPDVGILPVVILKSSLELVAAGALVGLTV